MRHAKQQTQTNGPFLKTVLVLWILALCGVFLVLPYVATLENEALAAAAARTHLEVWELLAISVAQTAVLLAEFIAALSSYGGCATPHAKNAPDGMSPASPVARRFAPS